MITFRLLATSSINYVIPYNVLSWDSDMPYVDHIILYTHHMCTHNMFMYMYKEHTIHVQSVNLKDIHCSM